jgi:hypothetical protein
MDEVQFATLRLECEVRHHGRSSVRNVDQEMRQGVL